MLSKLKQRKEGFTIIEVMIVLAIAGLIILIVLLAVPALQRNSRNTQRKNDVAAILSGVGNFINNNGGTLPGAKGGSSNDLQICGSTGCGSGNVENVKLGFYDVSKVSFGTAMPTTEDAVVIVTGKTCNSTGTAIGTAQPRTAAALYLLESNVKQCVEQ